MHVEHNRLSDRTVLPARGCGYCSVPEHAVRVRVGGGGGRVGGRGL